MHSNNSTVQEYEDDSYVCVKSNLYLINLLKGRCILINNWATTYIQGMI